MSEKLAQQKGLLAQSPRQRILGKEIHHLIPEHGGAAGFQNDDGHALFNLRLQRLQDLPQHPLCQVEHSVVVQGTAAA